MLLSDSLSLFLSKHSGRFMLEDLNNSASLYAYLVLHK